VKSQREEVVQEVVDQVFEIDLHAEPEEVKKSLFSWQGRWTTGLTTSHMNRDIFVPQTLHAQTRLLHASRR
jgi:hypothetical protein